MHRVLAKEPLTKGWLTGVDMLQGTLRIWTPRD